MKRLFAIIFISVFIFNIKADDLSALVFNIKSENIKTLIDNERENAEWVAKESPQIQFDFDSDHSEESLFFFNNLGVVNCVFSKFNKLERIDEYLLEDFNYSDVHDSFVKVDEINIRFHDFDNDNIPEIIIEIKFNESGFDEIIGYVYKIYGIGANLTNLKGLNGFLQKDGEFWGQYKYAEIDNNTVKTINFRELPLYYVFIDGKLREVK